MVAGSVPEVSPQMSWGESATLTRYHPQVAPDEAFTDKLMNDVAINASQHRNLNNYARKAGFAILAPSTKSNQQFAGWGEQRERQCGKLSPRALAVGVRLAPP